ncbi:hypothetical protein CRI94_06970 [Longibacter salinarum]|uniref:Tll0287-like domain-containing protein n=1 Tax=Longibacter salinarum TaxID=1850348 RepID=A0A2A8CYY1_9BACT|nr:DUF3365 domain-containing protein [Longibacter salinarum]PEN13803.1 hypothetical protein CRI94_06970 [Longibacter salinarum]
MIFSSSDIPRHTRATVFLALAFGLAVVAGCQTDNGGDDDTSASGDSVSTSAVAPPDSIRTSVVTAVRGIDQMRSQLATTFDPDNVTAETFERVCKPVGRRAKSVAQDSGWVVQQLAEKYRNPAHTLDSIAAQAHSRFESNPQETSFWRRTTLNGTEGWRYFHRITVEPSCLACHGPKESRPDFIKAGYPDDKAYDFDSGDLRGLYAVFVPDAAPEPSTDRPDSERP